MATINHTKSGLCSNGHIPTDRTTVNLTYSEQWALSVELDYKASDITAFRLAEDHWEYFIRPGAIKGHVAEPLLP